MIFENCSSSSTSEEFSGIAEGEVARSSTDTKSHAKVPKNIHKAEREKLKRDHLNELFLELGHTLESTHQNYGKACTVSDATKLLQDLIAQVEALRRENATLLNESQYVLGEKNELKEENTILRDEIKMLRADIRDRMHSSPAWTGSSASPTPLQPQPLPTALCTQQYPMVGSVYIVPLQQQDLTYTNSADDQQLPTSQQPLHARYPNQVVSWPFQMIPQQLGGANRCRSTTLQGDKGDSGEEGGSHHPKN